MEFGKNALKKRYKNKKKLTKPFQLYEEFMNMIKKKMKS